MSLYLKSISFRGATQPVVRSFFLFSIIYDYLCLLTEMLSSFHLPELLISCIKPKYLLFVCPPPISFLFLFLFLALFWIILIFLDGFYSTYWIFNQVYLYYILVVSVRIIKCIFNLSQGI